MSKTATQIIDAALKSIGILELDDTVGASGSTDAQQAGSDALEQLNDLLALSSADNLLIPYRTRKQITVNAQSYEFTMTERPLHVETLSYQSSSNTDIFLDRMDIHFFESIVNKNIVAWPSRFLYEPTYSNGTMYFDTTVESGKVFTMVYLAPLSSIAALTDTVTIPDEYVPFLRSETAIMCCGHFSVPVPANVSRLASLSRKTIRRRAGVLRIRDLQVDAGVPTTGRRRTNIEIDA